MKKTREEIEKYIDENVPRDQALVIRTLLDIKELLEKLVSKK